jgi:integrase
MANNIKSSPRDHELLSMLADGLSVIEIAAHLNTSQQLAKQGKPINMDALARDIIVPLATKAGVQWHGWHAFRRGLATNLYRLGVSDKTIQRILRQANVGVTQNCYLKTSDSDAAAAMQQFERFLQYAPNMHLFVGAKTQVM